MTSPAPLLTIPPFICVGVRAPFHKPGRYVLPPVSTSGRYIRDFPSTTIECPYCHDRLRSIDVPGIGRVLGEIEGNARPGEIPIAMVPVPPEYRVLGCDACSQFFTIPSEGGYQAWAS